MTSKDNSETIKNPKLKDENCFFGTIILDTGEQIAGMLCETPEENMFKLYPISEKGESGSMKNESECNAKPSSDRIEIRCKDETIICYPTTEGKSGSGQLFGIGGGAGYTKPSLHCVTEKELSEKASKIKQKPVKVRIIPSSKELD